ncbi:cytochrome P450 [Kibdelosporangium phytohabitans]|uniref:Cytochrome n=1 Tax=Kibdelosporangium phytohabitans TaxID=860235 RepID=A0A0N9I1K4_9PSEU|nr:cytochrome P450 [Kibdelosporangium phytohabitans]ALG09904.1 cytochrome [Kibdelosporangium phytohabitans]MBE1468692.1 biflaviolin synthase [Kibdelosporangium phytohabitans]
MTTESTSTTHPVRFWDVPDLRATDFDPLLAELLRDEPVSRVRLPNGDGYAWLVTRYADVRFVTSDPRFSRQAVLGRSVTRLAPHFIPLDDAVGFADPPEHTRLRRAVAKAFSAKSVHALRARTQQRMHGLVDAMQRHGSPADLMEHVHNPLPLAVVSDLMGVPEQDRPAMAEWSGVLLSAGHGRERSERAKAEVGAYFTTRLSQPGAGSEDELLGLLSAAIEREELTLKEAVGLAVLIQVSGAHAVRNNSGNMMYALLTHPGHLARLRTEPGLLPQAIEELLRWIPHRSGVGLSRIATEDVAVGDVVIRAGEAIYASYLTANRDPDVFDDPGHLDFDRAFNPHVSFGHGPHHCVASALARMESRIMVGTLLDRLPELRLAVPVEEVRWQRAALIRGPETLPVAW